LIYIDTSVVLAQLLAEDRRPPAAIWAETLVSSRLLEWEAAVRLNARGLAESHGELLRQSLGRIGFLEMVGPVLERAGTAFTVPVQTLEALHLASAEFLRAQGAPVRLASYDERLLDAARALGLPIVPLD